MTTELATSGLDRLLGYLEQDGDNLALRRDAIREACATGQWDTARELIDTGLRMHPDDAQILAASGFVHLHARRSEAAERVFLDLLARGHEAVELHYNVAFAQFMQQRYADAFERLNTCTELQAMPPALVLRARCLHHLRRIDEAQADCEACLALAPQDPEANGLLALILYECGQGEAALPYAQAALEQDPKQVEALLVVASRHAAEQEHEAARDTYDTLLEIDSQCGRAWLGRGLIELTHFKLDAALHDLELAATHMSEHIGTWHVLAWIHVVRGDVAAAKQAFEKALAIDRNFAESHGGVAVVAALEGREEDAQLSIKRALRLDPQALSPQYAQVILLQKQGKHEEASALFDALLARPAAEGERSYRDLATAQMQRLIKQREG